MSMKPEFFCCIGAELKDEIAGSLKSSRIFMYRAAESQTIADMLVNGFFNEADDLRVNDIILLYCPEQARSWSFAKVSSISGGVVKTTKLTVDPKDLEDIVEALDTFVKKDGSSIMTGPLKFRAGSFSGAIAGGLGDGVSIYKIKADGSIDSEVASLTKTNGFTPGTTNTQNIGSPTLKWKNLYLTGTAYITKINNGYDLLVPAKSGTLATKEEVDLAANSGSQLYDTGVWYAKMNSATVVPSGAEYNDRNYADFSQVDRRSGRPVIVIYSCRNGVWDEVETITPPDSYNGYITITSKIWDIPEQAGQQGGEILWSFERQRFTPYPKIVSFESINVTGNSTVVMPQNPTGNQIVNKDYVDNALVNHGTGRNVGDIFYTMRNDNELNGAVECDGATYNTTDFTGAQSIGALLEAGKIDYVSLSAYSTAISTKGWCDKIGWDGTGNTVFRVPTLNAHIVQTNNIPVIGNGLVLGLTNGTNTAGTTFNSNTTSINPNRDSYGLEVSSSGTQTGNGLSGRIGITEDPTKSGIIADTSDTAQLRVMIQLATSATDEALETCTGVLADVADLKDHRVIAFQAPTAQNNYTWYRKYADGWVEQGGVVESMPSSKYQDVVFPVTMTNANYTPSVTASWSASSTGQNEGVQNLTTTGMRVTTSYATATVWWEVKGMAQA